MSAAKKNSPERGISPISEEEFIRDFLPLPILHRGILFVLRTGYLIKQSPLEDLDVLGLCPTHTDEEEGALHIVEECRLRCDYPGRIGNQGPPQTFIRAAVN